MKPVIIFAVILAALLLPALCDAAAVESGAARLIADTAPYRPGYIELASVIFLLIGIAVGSTVTGWLMIRSQAHFCAEECPYRFEPGSDPDYPGFRYYDDTPPEEF